MKNEYIGDSLDLAKRKVLEIAKSIKCPCLVIPFPSPREQFEYDLYAKILGINRYHRLLRRVFELMSAFCLN
jgi:hypothetical protein